ncbi:MAG: hypothetical protein RRA94_08175, partial [Bacteroidota bacterium]|nr:hypothetical protein [Bacteroidota bacterium]
RFSGKGKSSPRQQRAGHGQKHAEKRGGKRTGSKNGGRREKASADRRSEYADFNFAPLSKSRGEDAAGSSPKNGKPSNGKRGKFQSQGEGTGAKKSRRRDPRFAR